MQYNKGRKNKPSDPCLRIDLVFSKKGAKFAKSVKENILIIYAPPVVARGTSALLFKKF